MQSPQVEQDHVSMTYSSPSVMIAFSGQISLQESQLMHVLLITSCLIIFPNSYIGVKIIIL
jgi:hypothetical protein